MLFPRNLASDATLDRRHELTVFAEIRRPIDEPAQAARLDDAAEHEIGLPVRLEDLSHPVAGDGTRRIRDGDHPTPRLHDRGTEQLGQSRLTRDFDDVDTPILYHTRRFARSAGKNDLDLGVAALLQESVEKIRRVAAIRRSHDHRKRRRGRTHESHTTDTVT